jgi:trimeric autotransporter adhesin
MKTILNSPYLALALFALAGFSLAPQARAVCQEGCDFTKGSTFLGDDALISNTGFDNVAVGQHALTTNTSGGYNTAIGVTALFSNTTGFINTAIGRQALYSNTTGEANTAIGEAALGGNGSFNTGIGTTALLSNTTGNNNTAVGNSALFSNTTGSSNIALGDAAGTKNVSGSNNIYIGNPGTHTDSSRIRIGTPGIQTKTFIAGISGATIPDGVGVVVGSNGQLGTIVSSARFKDAIQPMNKASEAILSLQPVTFHYKHDLDPAGIPQFGLVAEEVAKVNPDLVARDEEGKPYTVRYEAINAMLLNEFLKAHATISELKSMVAKQQEQITALASQIKTVSNRLELSKVASPRVAASEP